MLLRYRYNDGSMQAALPLRVVLDEPDLTVGWLDTRRRATDHRRHAALAAVDRRLALVSTRPGLDNSGPTRRLGDRVAGDL